MVDTFARMRQIIGTTADWTADNLILAAGEIGVEQVGGVARIKVGDGVTAFLSLPYSSSAITEIETLAGSGLTGGGISGKLTMAVDATVARLASPAFTGVPTSVTPSAGSGPTMIATKNYVDGFGASNYLPLTGGTVSGNLNVGGTLDVTGNVNLAFGSGRRVKIPAVIPADDNAADTPATPAWVKSTMINRGGTRARYRMSAATNADVDPTTGMIAVEVLADVIVNGVTYTARRIAMSMTDLDGTSRYLGALQAGDSVVMSDDATEAPVTGFVRYLLFTGVTVSSSVWGKFDCYRMEQNGTAPVAGNSLTVTGFLNNATGTGPIQTIDAGTNLSTGPSGGSSSTVTLNLDDNITLSSVTATNHLTAKTSLMVGTSTIGGNINARIELPLASNSTSYNLYSGTDIGAGVTNAYGVNSVMTSGPGAAVASVFHFSARANPKDAGAAVTDAWGFHASSTLTGHAATTRAAAFGGQLAAAVNVWNLHMYGTADNYLNGNLGLGTTTPQKMLEISADALSKIPTMRFSDTSTAIVADRSFGLLEFWSGNLAGAGAGIKASMGYYSANTNAIPYFTLRQDTGGTGTLTEVMRMSKEGILSAIGGLVAGTGTSTSSSLYLQKQMLNSTVVYGVRSLGQVQTGATTFYGYRSLYSMSNTPPFTLTSAYHYSADTTTPGAGSQITNQFGFYAAATLNDAVTANYGFYGAIATSATAWNLYMNGTAPNYLRGKLGVGIAPTAAAQLAVAGIIESTTGGVKYPDGTIQVKAFTTVPAQAGVFRVTKAGTQTNNVVTFTKVLLDTKPLDPDNLFTIATNRLIPPAGPVTLTFHCEFTADASVLPQFQICKNGAATVLANWSAPAFTASSSGTAEVTVNDAASGTDFYEVFMSATNGIGAILTTGAGVKTQFSGRYQKAGSVSLLMADEETTLEAPASGGSDAIPLPPDPPPPDDGSDPPVIDPPATVH